MLKDILLIVFSVIGISVGGTLIVTQFSDTPPLDPIATISWPTPVPVVLPTPDPKTAVEAPTAASCPPGPQSAPVTPVDPREATWTAPAGTTTVYAEVYDERGKFIDRYTISTYISIKPGYRLRVLGH